MLGTCVGGNHALSIMPGEIMGARVGWSELYTLAPVGQRVGGLLGGKVGGSVVPVGSSVSGAPGGTLGRDDGAIDGTSVEI